MTITSLFSCSPLVKLLTGQLLICSQSAFELYCMFQFRTEELENIVLNYSVYKVNCNFHVHMFSLRNLKILHTGTYIYIYLFKEFGGPLGMLNGHNQQIKCARQQKKREANGDINPWPGSSCTGISYNQSLKQKPLTFLESCWEEHIQDHLHLCDKKRC